MKLLNCQIKCIRNNVQKFADFVKIHFEVIKKKFIKILYFVVLHVTTCKFEVVYD